MEIADLVVEWCILHVTSCNIHVAAWILHLRLGMFITQVPVVTCTSVEWASSSQGLHFVHDVYGKVMFPATHDWWCMASSMTVASPGNLFLPTIHHLNIRLPTYHLYNFSMKKLEYVYVLHIVWLVGMIYLVAGRRYWIMHILYILNDWSCRENLANGCDFHLKEF